MLLPDLNSAYFAANIKSLPRKGAFWLEWIAKELGIWGTADVPERLTLLTAKYAGERNHDESTTVSKEDV